MLRERKLALDIERMKVEIAKIKDSVEFLFSEVGSLKSKVAALNVKKEQTAKPKESKKTNKGRKPKK